MQQLEAVIELLQLVQVCCTARFTILSLLTAQASIFAWKVVVHGGGYSAHHGTVICIHCHAPLKFVEAVDLSAVALSAVALPQFRTKQDLHKTFQEEGCFDMLLIAMLG